MRFHERYRPMFSPEGEGAAGAGETTEHTPPPGTTEQDPPSPQGGGEGAGAGDGGGQGGDGAGDAGQHGNKGKTPWYMTRLAEESAKAREAQERADAAERRARDAEQLAARNRAAQDGTSDQRQQNYQQPHQQTAEERQAEIRREAQNQRFYEDTVDVRNRGMSQYGSEFNDSLNILGHLGISTNLEFIGDVLAVDKAKAHEMLNTLAKEPEKAMELARLSSRQRIAELTRMQMASTKPAADTALAPQQQNGGKGVSRAPAPAPRVQPSASKEKDWRSDEASDEEFSRGFDQRMKERAARR